MIDIQNTPTIKEVITEYINGTPVYIKFSDGSICEIGNLLEANNKKLVIKTFANMIITIEIE